MNTNFKLIALTRLGIKPESTALETDALTTRPPELLVFFNYGVVNLHTLREECKAGATRAEKMEANCHRSTMTNTTVFSTIFGSMLISN